MKTTLRWKKNFFSSTYSIYSNEKMLGKLRDNAFTQSADGTLYGENYYFRTKGIFKQNTTIIDKEDNKAIGNISYNTWMTKATIKISNKTYFWKYDNLWNTKWSIHDSDGILIKFTGSTTSGLINSKTEDALLLLSGLFVTNYYIQITIVIMIAIFIPIYMSIFK